MSLYNDSSLEEGELSPEQEDNLLDLEKELSPVREETILAVHKLLDEDN